MQVSTKQISPLNNKITILKRIPKQKHRHKHNPPLQETPIILDNLLQESNRIGICVIFK